MAGMKVLDGMPTDTNFISYMANDTAIEELKARCWHINAAYGRKGGAFYAFAINGKAFGFIGPDTPDFYMNLSERFLQKYPATDTELPVLDIPQRNYARGSKKVM